MATEPDDLEEEIEATEIDEEQQAPAEDDESEVTLEGEEPAQAADGESSTIREMRAAMREKDRVIREQEAKLAATTRPALPTEPGLRPKLEDFNFDGDAHDAAVDKWVSDKIAYEQATREATEQAQQIEQRRLDGYTAAKSAVKIAGIDDAEKRVFEQVDDMTRNALLHAKSPAVIAALDKYPDKLAAIADASKRGDAAEMLLLIGELRAKAQIMPRRKNAEPEQVLNGSASIASASSDKQLEKLEKEADRTGDRTKIAAYKKQLRAAGKTG